MIDFMYNTPYPGDRVCMWLDELCQLWDGRYLVSRDDDTRLWVVRSDGKRVEIEDFGDNVFEFREIIEEAIK